MCVRACLRLCDQALRELNHGGSGRRMCDKITTTVCHLCLSVCPRLSVSHSLKSIFLLHFSKTTNVL